MISTLLASFALATAPALEPKPTITICIGILYPWCPNYPPPPPEPKGNPGKGPKPKVV